jgi:hypothetical protein
VVDQPAIANAGNNNGSLQSNQLVNISGSLSGGTNSGVWPAVAVEIFLLIQI